MTLPGMKSALDIVLILAAVTAVAMFAAVRLDRTPPPDRVPLELPPLEFMAASEAAGGTVQFPAPDQGATLVFVFQSSCPVCAEVAESWRLLADRAARSPGSTAIALSGDPRERALRWLETHELPVNELLLAVDPEEVVRSWNVTGVPLTLVLDGDRVQYSAVGLLSPDQSKRIADFLFP